MATLTNPPPTVSAIAAQYLAAMQMRPPQQDLGAVGGGVGSNRPPGAGSAAPQLMPLPPLFNSPFPPSGFPPVLNVPPLPPMSQTAPPPFANQFPSFPLPLGFPYGFSAGFPHLPGMANRPPVPFPMGMGLPFPLQPGAPGALSFPRPLIPQNLNFPYLPNASHQSGPSPSQSIPGPPPLPPTALTSSRGSEGFADHLSIIAVSHLVSLTGFDRAHVSTCAVLADIFERYLALLCTKTKALAEQSCRVTIQLEDVAFALDEMGADTVSMADFARLWIVNREKAANAASEAIGDGLGMLSGSGMPTGASAIRTAKIVQASGAAAFPRLEPGDFPLTIFFTTLSTTFIFPPQKRAS
ncbi:hypothetical protein BJ742DRAFT_417686 [Cladochytrium replicatum]|nr:hypothetical protein BJ742DRAFT_417686 [Cladochytrium replicatum]